MPPSFDLVLASTSRYRQALFERLGLTPRLVDPEVDETPLQGAIADPRELAGKLALAKATAGLARAAGRRAHTASTSGTLIIVAGDQVCWDGGQALHKPGTPSQAVAQLLGLQGRTHSLFTAAAVVTRDGPPSLHVDETRLTMRPLTAAQCRRYVAADDPSDCAGAYRIESRGLALFERIDTADFSAIEGLPMLAVIRELTRLGLEIP